MTVAPGPTSPHRFQSPPSRHSPETACWPRPASVTRLTQAPVGRMTTASVHKTRCSWAGRFSGRSAWSSPALPQSRSCTTGCHTSSAHLSRR